MVWKGRLTEAIRPVYNVVRPLLPRKWGVINGVAVRDFRLLDVRDHQPDRMAGLIKAIREVVEPGDRVVDVATGRGVAAVWASRAGADRVDTYEASAEYCEMSRQTILAAQVEGVHVHHAVVGDDIEIWGNAGGAGSISPMSLPKCDVLQLDCEGAELSILSGLAQRPRTIIVETHPGFGAPSDTVRAAVEERGYRVEIRVYEPGKPDKDVLIATERD